jgi:DNA-3-methyladenine glycosylase I
MADALNNGIDGVVRCGWCGDDELYQHYHDTEWGHPLHGENAVFEKIVLEGMQAGLAWITILRKRETFREVFENFDIPTVARFTDADCERLLANPGIIRNKGKIEAAISNAQIVEAMLDKGESLDKFCWGYAPAKRERSLRIGDPIPAHTKESTSMSRALIKRGFKFVGPTTMYAFMQSAGMVDDHIDGCQTRPKPA